MYGVMIALASGALMSIQGVFNTDVTKQTSLWVSAAFVQFTALLVCLAAWLLYDRTSFGSLWEIQDKYVLLGGAIGALITATVIRSMNALGPAKAAMLIVIAQLAVAWMMDSSTPAWRMSSWDFLQCSSGHCSKSRSWSRPTRDQNSAWSP